jgi:hypothetical protein
MVSTIEKEAVDPKSNGSTGVFGNVSIISKGIIFPICRASGSNFGATGL